MHFDDEGSVTAWIGNLKAGDHEAARLLWGRYFPKLVTLARRKLMSVHRTGADEDEEDAALSAFDSLCAGAARGRFTELGDRDDLWRLLVVITARKAFDQIERRGRKKRGGGQVVGEGTLAGAADGQANVLDQMVGQEPTPEFAAMVADQCRSMLDSLGDPTLRQVALWRMEGYTEDEIAERLGCARRSVARKLDLIRKKILSERT
jgi:DNA-directed RNA polymerase specialized sigma24 family protein